LNSFFYALLFTLISLPVYTVTPVRADAVDDYINEQMRQRHIPGLSLAIVKDGKVVKARGYGFANLEHKVPATANTVYYLGSIGKQFTATGIMMLVQKGKVNLDEKVSHYLPGLPAAWADVRVRNLLNHTAGIPDYMSAPGLVWKLDYSYEQIIDLAANRPPHFAPGQAWRYVNTSYLLLDRIIQTISGQSWDALLTQEVFRPLRMTSTRRSSRGVISNRTAPYDWDEKNTAWSNTDYLNPSLFINGSGGLLSSVLDLAKRDTALYGEGILKQATLMQMWTPTRLGDGATKNYGFGWGLEEQQGHRRIGHSGGCPGFEANISRFVDDKLTIIILTNLLGSNPWEMSGVVAGMYEPALAARKPTATSDKSIERAFFVPSTASKLGR
jgi:CubicO group peptidase (beta-lactamase class C family)